jgi:hypothetical protein
MFAFGASKLPPFIKNTRIYSCNFIRNDVPFRWRGRLNEDTIMSLDMLKKGWCTIQFNAFLQEKLATQQLKGGNSSDFYWKDGTLPKSQMLKNCHPDVTKIVTKFGRVHHHVNYGVFRNMNLIKKADYEINDYNLELKVVKNDKKTKGEAKAKTKTKGKGVGSNKKATKAQATHEATRVQAKA